VYNNEVDSLLTTFTSLPTQVLVLGTLILLIFITGIRFGRSHIVSALLSLYISSFIYSHVTLSRVADSATMATPGTFWNYLGIFLLFFIPIHVVLLRVIMTDFGDAPMKYVRAAGMAVLLTGLLISISYHVIPILPVFDFAPSIDALFASDMAFAAWLILPLVVLFF
jgi:hypothetical protein